MCADTGAYVMHIFLLALLIYGPLKVALTPETAPQPQSSPVWRASAYGPGRFSAASCHWRAQARRGVPRTERLHEIDTDLYASVQAPQKASLALLRPRREHLRLCVIREGFQTTQTQ